jgi:site-specific DNA recombinase
MVMLMQCTETRGTSTLVEGNSGSEVARNESLIKSIVRAHVWVRNLQDGTYDSIEALAEANPLHPKVIRHALRLAFLSPGVTSAVLEGRQPAVLSLARVPKLLPLAWTEHRRLLACAPLVE